MNILKRKAVVAAAAEEKGLRAWCTELATAALPQAKGAKKKVILLSTRCTRC